MAPCVQPPEATGTLTRVPPLPPGSPARPPAPSQIICGTLTAGVAGPAPPVNAHALGGAERRVQLQPGAHHVQAGQVAVVEDAAFIEGLRGDGAVAGLEDPVGRRGGAGGPSRLHDGLPSLRALEPPRAVALRSSACPREVAAHTPSLKFLSTRLPVTSVGEVTRACTRESGQQRPRSTRGHRCSRQPCCSPAPWRPLAVTALPRAPGQR